MVSLGIEYGSEAPCPRWIPPYELELLGQLCSVCWVCFHFSQTSPARGAGDLSSKVSALWRLVIKWHTIQKIVICNFDYFKWDLRDYLLNKKIIHLSVAKGEIAKM